MGSPGETLCAPRGLPFSARPPVDSPLCRLLQPRQTPPLSISVMTNLYFFKKKKKQYSSKCCTVGRLPSNNGQSLLGLISVSLGWLDPSTLRVRPIEPSALSPNVKRAPPSYSQLCYHQKLSSLTPLSQQPTLCTEGFLLISPQSQLSLAVSGVSCTALALSPGW